MNTLLDDLEYARADKALAIMGILMFKSLGLFLLIFYGVLFTIPLIVIFTIITCLELHAFEHQSDLIDHSREFSYMVYKFDAMYTDIKTLEIVSANNSHGFTITSNTPHEKG